MKKRDDLSPSNNDYERSILSAMLIDPESCREAVKLLEPSHFCSGVHQSIFSAAADLHSNGDPVDSPTVLTKLKEKGESKQDTGSYLAGLLEHPMATSIEHYAREILSKHGLRKTIKNANEIIKAFASGNGDAGEILAKAKRDILELDLGELKQSRLGFDHNETLMENTGGIEWRIQGILEDKSRYCDVGDPGSYKTFIALDRLLHIAAGIEYHGRETKQGVCFYVCGEGKQGIGRRIQAWHGAHGTNPKDVPFFISNNPTELMSIAALDQVRYTVDEISAQYGPPAVVHFDTLARNFGDGDENNTADMNKVIQNLDRAFGADFCIGLTHHTGHANKNRGRGSMALPGAIDTEFLVKLAEDNRVVVRCTKMKESFKSPTMLFSPKEMKLILADGKKDTSYAMELVAEGAEASELAGDKLATRNVSGNMEKAVQVLGEMYARYEKNMAKHSRDKTEMPRVEIGHWWEECKRKNLYATRSAFKRSVKRMVKKKLVHCCTNMVFACTGFIYLKYQEKGILWN